MGSVYNGFGALTGQDPLAQSNDQFIQHCQQQAMAQQLRAQWESAGNAYHIVDQSKPIYGKCSYCKTLFHNQAHECASCGAPR